MPEESVWDKAARAILETQAQSRFTRSPITIKNPSLKIAALAKALEADGIGVGTPTIDNSGEPPTGAYYPSGKIEVTAHGPNPSYAELQNVIHHEDIHALLEKAGIDSSKVPSTPWYQNLVYLNPIDKAIHSFYAGKRAGSLTDELPAYVGAFDPKQMPEFTEGDRQRFLTQFKTILPDKVAQTFQRLLNSYQASQTPPQ